MPENEPHTTEFDWRLTSFEGSRREQLRRWAQLPLENILLAIEEMQDIAQVLGAAPSGEHGEPLQGASVKEPPVEYGNGDADHDIELKGCTPEPLMAYLKALGILRLVSEQKDTDARGWWRNDVFWLQSPKLFGGAATEEAKRNALTKFFLEEYKPTPIVVPWSGGDFLGVNWQPKRAKRPKTPTSSQAIEAILCTKASRLESYRLALSACKTSLDKCGIDTKERMGREKWSFIQALRSSCEEPQVLEWIDAAAIIGVEKFASLLGSGGGSDGNTHFSDNFMQNLWDVLPDFDDQRQGRKNQMAPSVLKTSQRQLNDSLFAIRSNNRVFKRTSSLYDSGAVGGPNATQGMERESLSNPWDVILALEGTVAFAGAAVKRLTANPMAAAAFPFQVSVSVTIRERLADKEQSGSEAWLPLWTRPTRADEVLLFLQEGRAECGARSARSGIDMARAIASLGIDRGVKAFRRYAIVKGRVGGDNYNTAALLGRFEVIERSGVDLLREIDRWLSDFRWKCARGRDKEEAPKRILSTLTGIDSAIFEFCNYGGPRLFQEIVIALGRAERELAVTQGQFKRKSVNPILQLSSEWMPAVDDRSPEFAIARALASVHDPEAKIGPLRGNLEPVNWKKRCRAWAEKNRAIVWNAGDLATNLANVLQRRMMDGRRAGCERLPLASRFAVPLDTVVAFLAGELDDQRIADLIWGLVLINDLGNRNTARHETTDLPLPRVYALLKLLFLSRPLIADRVNGALKWRLARDGEKGVAIRPEPRILPLLLAGRVGEACRIAAQRLRVSGLPPMPGGRSTGMMRDNDWSECAINDRRAQRLAAALLIPIDSHSVNYLVRLVCRDTSVTSDLGALTTEGEFA